MLFGRKLLVAALALSIALAIPAQAVTTPKSGASCRKLGQISILQNKKFTCVKSGKKLIWNSGVTIKSPSPTPAGFIAPTVAPKSISDLDPATTWYFAWKSMEETRKRNSSRTALVKILMAPNSRPDVKDVIAAGVNAGASFWSDFWSPEKPIRVLIGTEKDLDFWKANTEKSLFEAIQTSFKEFGAQANGAAAGWNLGEPSMNFTYGSAQTGATISANNWQTAPHEYTHIAQGVVGNPFVFNSRNYLWMSEGQAEYTGLFLSTNSPESYLAYRNKRLIHQWSNSDQRSATSPENILTMLRPDSANQVANGNYSYGTAAWEAITALYGHQAVVSYFNKVRAGATNSTAFNDVFGMTADDLLTQLAPYLAKLRLSLLP